MIDQISHHKKAISAVKLCMYAQEFLAPCSSISLELRLIDVLCPVCIFRKLHANKRTTTRPCRRANLSKLLVYACDVVMFSRLGINCLCSSKFANPARIVVASGNGTWLFFVPGRA